tara:strand:+ start:287 stop:934 length:648 start_codon:yes stop_codon:yes gene_type:complete
MTTDEFIQSLRKRDIICPFPMFWQKFFMHFMRRVKDKVELPNPLVLSGWDVSNNYQKRERFESHIKIFSNYHGFGSVKRYLDRFIKETEYYRSDYVDPDEISDMVYGLECWTKVDNIVSESENPLKKLIELKPEIDGDDDKLRWYLREYEDDVGISNYNEKKLRLVHDKSEFRMLIQEIYNIYLKQKDMEQGMDIHDFCTHAICNLEPILFKSDF